jgi:hypothetical protein
MKNLPLASAGILILCICFLLLPLILKVDRLYPVIYFIVSIVVFLEMDSYSCSFCFSQTLIVWTLAKTLRMVCMCYFKIVVIMPTNGLWCAWFIQVPVLYWFWAPGIETSFIGWA